MKFEKVTYQKLFSLPNYENERLGVEGYLEEGETVEEAMEQARDKIREAFRSMNGAVSFTQQLPEPLQWGLQDTATVRWDRHEEPTTTAREKQIQSIIDQINKCTAISEVNKYGVEVGLVSFEKIAFADPMVREAYDNKLKSLQ